MIDVVLPMKMIRKKRRGALGYCQKLVLFFHLIQSDVKSTASLKE